jgi:hypothetical protein
VFTPPSLDGEICVSSIGKHSVYGSFDYLGKRGIAVGVAMYEGVAERHFANDAWSFFCEFTGKRIATTDPAETSHDEAWINP